MRHANIMRYVTIVLLFSLGLLFVVGLINPLVQDRIGGSIGLVALIAALTAVAFLNPDVSHHLLAPLRKSRMAKIEESKRIHAERSQQWRERERQGQERVEQETRERLAKIELRRKQGIHINTASNPLNGQEIPLNGRKGEPAGTQTETTFTNGNKPV